MNLLILLSTQFKRKNVQQVKQKTVFPQISICIQTDQKFYYNIKGDFWGYQVELKNWGKKWLQICHNYRVATFLN